MLSTHLDIQIFMLCHCLYSSRHFSSDTVNPSIKSLLCGKSNCALSVCFSLLTSIVSLQVTIKKSPNFLNHMHWHLLVESLALYGLDYGLWLIILHHRMSLPNASVLESGAGTFCTYPVNGNLGNFYPEILRQVWHYLKAKTFNIFITHVDLKAGLSNEYF